MGGLIERMLRRALVQQRFQTERVGKRRRLNGLVQHLLCLGLQHLIRRKHIAELGSRSPTCRLAPPRHRHPQQRIGANSPLGRPLERGHGVGGSVDAHHDRSARSDPRIVDSPVDVCGRDHGERARCVAGKLPAHRTQDGALQPVETTRTHHQLIGIGGSIQQGSPCRTRRRQLRHVGTLRPKHLVDELTHPWDHCVVNVLLAEVPRRMGRHFPHGDGKQIRPGGTRFRSGEAQRVGRLRRTINSNHDLHRLPRLDSSPSCQTPRPPASRRGFLWLCRDARSRH